LPASAGWHRHIALAFVLARLGVALALLALALEMRSPLLASVRPAVLAALIAAPLLLIVIDAWRLRGKRPTAMPRVLRIAVILAAGAALTATLTQEAQFRWVRSRVLAADPARLEMLGRHFVVGYRDDAEIARLVEHRAIGGVFMGARNVEGRSVDEIRAQIAAWQDVRRG
jgi:beta-N-acetylhexosaminidase